MHRFGYDVTKPSESAKRCSSFCNSSTSLSPCLTLSFLGGLGCGFDFAATSDFLAVAGFGVFGNFGALNGHTALDGLATSDDFEEINIFVACFGFDADVDGFVALGVFTALAVFAELDGFVASDDALADFGVLLKRQYLSITSMTFFIFLRLFEVEPLNSPNTDQIHSSNLRRELFDLLFSLRLVESARELLDCVLHQACEVDSYEWDARTVELDSIQLTILRSISHSVEIKSMIKRRK